MNPMTVLTFAIGAFWLQQTPPPSGTVPGTFPPVSQKHWAVVPKPPQEDPEQKVVVNRRMVAVNPDDKTVNRDQDAEDAADWDLIHASGIIKGSLKTTAKTHVVIKGETLWDLAERYFGDAWFWPELWSWNAHITNPHWLFPGTIVNLTNQPATAVDMQEEKEQTEKFYGLSLDTSIVTVRHRAFIDEKTMKESRGIIGSPEEKSLLTVGDHLYIKDADRKLKPGNTYTVFRPLKKVNDTMNKQQLGQLVQVLGEVKILEHRPENVLKAEITHSIAVIRRKDMVGTVQTRFRQVKPRKVATEKRLVGKIVATIEESELLSANDMVVLNLGKNKGLLTGATLAVIVRGDGLYAHLHPLDPSRKRDQGLPYEVKGTLVVYEVHEHYCFAVILRSQDPIRVGDEVLFGQTPDTPEKSDAPQKP